MEVPPTSPPIQRLSRSKPLTKQIAIKQILQNSISTVMLILLFYANWGTKLPRGFGGGPEHRSLPLPNLPFSPQHSAPTTKWTQVTLTASFPTIPQHEIYTTVQLGSEHVPCSSYLHSFAHISYLTRMYFPTSPPPSEILSRLHGPPQTPTP